MPIWVQYVQALAPTCIAFAAGIIASLIALRQWKTAHQRGILDLFEIRIAVYQELRIVIASVMSGHSSDTTYLEFLKAEEKVPFLFGRDVQPYIDGLRQDLNIHSTQCSVIAGLNGEAYTAAMKLKGEKFKRITAFYDEFPKLIAPYVEMHQKIP